MSGEVRLLVFCRPSQSCLERLISAGEYKRSRGTFVHFASGIVFEVRQVCLSEHIATAKHANSREQQERREETSERKFRVHRTLLMASIQRQS